MSWDLSGQGDDLVYTNAKNYFGYDDFMQLFPSTQDTLDPIVPRGTAFEKPSIDVKPLLLEIVFISTNLPT
jgi:penicillin amidase